MMRVLLDHIGMSVGDGDVGEMTDPLRDSSRLPVSSFTIERLKHEIWTVAKDGPVAWASVSLSICHLASRGFARQNGSRCCLGWRLNERCIRRCSDFLYEFDSPSSKSRLLWPLIIVTWCVAWSCGAECATATTADARLMTVVEADVHRVDSISDRPSRRFQSSCNSSPVKTSQKWTNSRSSPRHPALSDLRDGDIHARQCGPHIGRTSSNVETRSSATVDNDAMRSRRVHSCEYDARTTSTPVAERLRQLSRVRSTWSASRVKQPAVLLVPPLPPERTSSDKVPRYNDTGSFEEVDERLLMLAEYHVNRCSNAASATAAGPQTVANVRTSPAGPGSRSSSVLQNVVSAQYRQLWDLRATLEQSEDLSDDGQSELTALVGPARRHSGDKSRAGTCERPPVSAPSLLPLPSQVRRQTYQHVAAEKRFRHAATATATTTSGATLGASVDSVEAPETDGDASDTSRHDLTTSFESSTTTTTTTTTTDNNTDAGDGRACPPSSRIPTRLPLPTARTRLDAAPQDGKRQENLNVDAASRMPADPPRSSAFTGRSCFDASNLVATVEHETSADVTAASRTAAHKRRDFRNERTSVHRLALDRDDIHSSTDQPSGDSIDGSSSVGSPGAVTLATPVTKCGPSTALRRFLSYQLGSSSTGTRHLRSRHTVLRDYRLVMAVLVRISFTFLAAVPTVADGDTEASVCLSLGRLFLLIHRVTSMRPSLHYCIHLGFFKLFVIRICTCVHIVYSI